MLQSADGYLDKNKWVLRDLLNEPTDWLCIIAGGNWFQSLGANPEKSPVTYSLVSSGNIESRLWGGSCFVTRLTVGKEVR